MRFLACLILSVALIALAFNVVKPLPSTNFDESFLPKASTVRYIAAGNDAAVAGLFWIKGLTELGESYLTGKEYAYLSHVANLSTSLDSLFFTPYYFVGGVTPTNATDTSDYAVLRRANKVFPENWRLSLYYAMRLAHGPGARKAEAAAVMRPYFDSPDTTIPEHIRIIYKSFAFDTMQVEMALETALNDIMQPQFKKFRGSFYSKIVRLLGYRGFQEEGKENILEQVKYYVDGLSEGKIPPAIVYNELLKLQKQQPQPTPETAGEEGDKHEKQSL